MDTCPVTARSLGFYYKVDGDTLERAYKEHLSGYRQWEDKPHADRYLLFPENFGMYMSIDETSTKDGELFTILSNKEAHGRKGSIAAIVSGTRVEDVVDSLMLVPEAVRKKVGVITMDFSSGMAAIAEQAFPWAYRILDRFHMQKMAIEAVNNLRLKHKREAIKAENAARKEFRRKQKARRTHIKNTYKIYRDGGHPLPRVRPFVPERLSNGDTLPELLTRSSYLLTMSPDKWTVRQEERAGLLFSLYPDIKTAFGLSHSLRVIFSNKHATCESAKASLSEWYGNVSNFKNDDLHVLAETLQSREDEVLNFFLFHRTNASAESLNAKIKAFRSQLRGIIDLKFFLFRLTRIFA